MHTPAVPLASDTPSSATSRPDEPEVLGRQNASSACVLGRSAINQRACKWGKHPPPRRSESGRAPRAGACVLCESRDSAQALRPLPRRRRAALPTSVCGYGSRAAASALFPESVRQQERAVVARPQGLAGRTQPGGLGA
uniref:Uncharacterized protein n=1 Tax=Rangifer tarandus platyrhynchus TaxID=3082113 RepID=A0ACB0DZM2_RANTA|nr:unnamed protein product [Rangifer tarandus platyrhynchus]